MIVVLVYAILFGAGLLWFRSRSPLFRARHRPLAAAGAAGAPGTAATALKSKTSKTSETSATSAASGTSAEPAPPAAPAPQKRANEAPLSPALRRAALLAGDDVAPAARDRYARRISAARCTCGCDRTVRSCLARDSSCSRSAELAEKIRDSFR